MVFEEEKKSIQGYEGIYEITRSGKIITLRENRPLTRCNEEYGFHIVKLNKNGKSENYNVFELWGKAFSKLNSTEFKGTRKVKYGTGCQLIQK